VATNRLTVLSEQNLIDCSGEKYGNFGCNGGSPPGGLQYIADSSGVNTDQSYPYTATDGNVCKFNRQLAGAKITGFKSVPYLDEVELKKVVATVGPVAAALYVSDQFMYYADGVYNEPGCSTNLNHGVIYTIYGSFAQATQLSLFLQFQILIVGYGTENGKDFWIVKNSWGEGWGESGYFRLARGSNMCGIAAWAVYPV
jgi:Papain family cysteine protease